MYEATTGVHEAKAGVHMAKGGVPGDAFEEKPGPGKTQSMQQSMENARFTSKKVLSML